MSRSTQATEADPPEFTPPPWRLTGHGYVLLLRCTRAFGNACARGQPGLEGRALGGMAALMLVDYAGSDVGPYRELLLCPGSFRVGRRKAAAITHIWVSTQTSVINGRRNWGLPKREAGFERLDAPQNGADPSYRVRLGDAPALRLGFSPRGPRLPVTTALLPRRWHTLLQPWEGRRYETRIQARGRARLARLCDYANPADSGFPDIATQTWIGALTVCAFRMRFPAARISDA